MKNAVALQVGKGVTSAMVTERPWNSWEPGNETSPRALLGLAYLSRLLKAFLSPSLCLFVLFVLEIFLFFIFICVSHESIYTLKDLVHHPWPLAKSLCKSLLIIWIFETFENFNECSKMNIFIHLACRPWPLPWYVPWHDWITTRVQTGSNLLLSMFCFFRGNLHQSLQIYTWVKWLVLF